MKNKSDLSRRSLISVLLLGASGTLAYPPAGSLYNSYLQHEDSKKYDAEIQKALRQEAPGVEPEAVVAARQYNTTLNGIPILDPFIDDIVSHPTAKYAEYNKQLADSEIMAA